MVKYVLLGLRLCLLSPQKNAIKNDPQWTQPIEDWTVNMLTGQIDEMTHFLNNQTELNSKEAVDMAVKHLFQGGTILKFPQKLQDIFLNNVGEGYQKEFNQPIDKWNVSNVKRKQVTNELIELKKLRVEIKRSKRERIRVMKTERSIS
jgi:histone acetyltransferase (RNA polymerase elongator complex component)